MSQFANYDGHNGYVPQSNKMPKVGGRPLGGAPQPASWMSKPTQRGKHPVPHNRRATTTGAPLPKATSPTHKRFGPKGGGS